MLVYVYHHPDFIESIRVLRIDVQCCLQDPQGVPAHPFGSHPADSGPS